jgi:hypothetical protein
MPSRGPCWLCAPIGSAFTMEGQGTLKHVDFDMTVPNRDSAVNDFSAAHLVLGQCVKIGPWGPLGRKP